MALTLSVGFVVDDAIVMLENIVRHMEEGDRPSRRRSRGRGDRLHHHLHDALPGGGLHPGIVHGRLVGRLLHEFAVTIVLAILVSGIVSLTLTPMLCSRFVRPSTAASRAGLPHLRAGLRPVRAAMASLEWALAHRPLIFLVFLGSLAGTVYFFRDIPKDFLPSEDTNQIVAYTEGADGLSFAEMIRHQQSRRRRGPPGSQYVRDHVLSGGGRAAGDQQFRQSLLPADAARPAQALGR